MQQPCAIAPFYGWLTWLNRGGAMFPAASPSSWFMVGAGGHYVWIDPEHEAVVVVRWLDPAHSGGFVERVAEAVQARVRRCPLSASSLRLSPSSPRDRRPGSSASALTVHLRESGRPGLPPPRECEGVYRE
jgi:CubicO group peptidase (beta-lactamase class C family)